MKIPGRHENKNAGGGVSKSKEYFCVWGAEKNEGKSGHQSMAIWADGGVKDMKGIGPELVQGEGG